MKAFRADSLAVEVHDDRAAMGAAAARAAADCLRHAVAQRGGARVIFAAAPSQSDMLASLVREPGIDWNRITAFHMDEYLGLPDTHQASFRRFMRVHVAAPLAPGRFHFIQGDADQPLDECDRYTALLREAPIDLCCLGIGENGHVAFNDPPVARFDDPRLIKLVALDEACRLQQVAEGHFPTLDHVPRYAFTLTVPALCSAARMICVVPGPRKSQAVRDAILGPITTACPATVLRTMPQCTLFVDSESAGQL
jgi:glucosamine-6-phosphate deaminase